MRDQPRPMSREQVLRKVLACLRLSKSANVHEAANAMRQAKALMAKYGLTEADAAAAQIEAAEASTRSRGGMVPLPVVALAQVIAGGYRCRVLVSCEKFADGRGRTRIQFYGSPSEAQVSAYAFTVLRRQMESDRAAHLRDVQRRRRKKWPVSDKAKAGEAFSLSWVSAVRDLFPREQVSDDHEKALQAAIDQQTPTVVEPVKAARSNKKHLDSQIAGYLAGKGARLNQGLSGSRQQQLQLESLRQLEHAP